MDDAVLEYKVAVADKNRKKSKGRPPTKEEQALQEAERYGVEIARLQGEGESHVNAVHWVAQTYHVGDRTVENRWRLYKDEIAEQILWLIRRGHTEEAAIKTVVDSLETNEKTVRIAYNGWKNKNPEV